MAIRVLEVLEPLGTQQGGHEVDQQEQHHDGGQHEHGDLLSNLLAADDECEHQPQRTEAQEDQERNPKHEVHGEVLQATWHDAASRP
jgi:hypothetical protein